MLDVTYPRYGYTLPIHFLDIDDEPKKDKPVSKNAFDRSLKRLLSVSPKEDNPDNL
jgi:hypothetical protein